MSFPSARRTSSSPISATASAAPSSRIVGLDGIRALAVIGVVAYHLAPAALPGGFIGVDVFFVLSGYLITRTLRLRPAERLPDLLRRFYQHRARRILPPLLTVVIITTASAGVLGGNVLPGLWTSVIGALTFSSNWISIAQTSSYFTGTSAHPLQHLWSLAVEEQFYLVWPFVLLLLGAVSRRARTWVIIVLGLSSAAAMAVLFTPGADPTPVYVATGTHLFGLTFGAALASTESLTTGALHSRLRRTITFVAGGAALTGLIIAAFHLTDVGTGTYRGGLLGIAALTTVLVWALTRGGTGLGKLLDIAPLQLLGRRSYALYLWHWPALVLLTALTQPRTPLERTLVGTVTVCVSLLATTASWRFVEAPILQSGWRASIRSWTTRSQEPTRWLSVITAIALLIGSAFACVTSTKPSEAQQLIIAGQQYLHDHPAPTNTARPTDSAAPQPASSPSPTAGETSPASTPTAVPTPEPVRTPAPNPASLTQTPITAIGDSVMLAAAPSLQLTLPDVSINAEVSRQGSGVAPILQADAANGHLADTVVVGIGTNGELGSALPQIRAALGPDRTLILVTAHGDRPWIPDVNSTMHAFAATDPHTVIADWDRAITPHEDLLASDGIHPGTAGGRLYAQTILAALTAAHH